MPSGFCRHQLAQTPRQTSTVGCRYPSEVVIVPTRVELDRSAAGQGAEAGDVGGGGARADHEEVDHPLGGPGFDVDPVEATPRDVFGDSGGQQVGPPAAPGDLVQGGADLAHEAGQQVAVVPLLPFRKQHRDPGEVDRDAVVVVHRGDFPQDCELEVPGPLAAEIPVHVPLVDEPVRVPCLQRDRVFEAMRGIEEVVVVGAVDAVGEEDLPPPFPSLVEEHLHRVDARLPPGGEDVLRARQHLARPDRGVPLPPLVPDAVDLVRRRLQAAHVEGDQPFQAGGADFAAAEGVVGEDVVLEDDAALPGRGERMRVVQTHDRSGRARLSRPRPVPRSISGSPGRDRPARARGRFR